MLIGIGHKKQSGKDLAAKIIIIEELKKSYFPEGTHSERLEEFYDESKDIITKLTGIEIKKFANNLKGIICILTGCNMRDLENDEFKATDFPYQINQQVITYRQALQEVGAEVFRNWCPNIWVDSVFKDYNETSKWIITDVRFKNEADKIRENGGILLNIKRNSEVTDTHISETEMDDYPYDMVIENNGSILDLLEKISKSRMSIIEHD